MLKLALLFLYLTGIIDSLMIHIVCWNCCVSKISKDDEQDSLCEKHQV